MKSALFATIFGIVGGVTILLAFPAEEKRAALEFRQAKAELGLPPQIEDDVAVTPEPVDQYSIVHVKPKTQTTTSRHRHIARRRLNFFEKLVVGFINLQKHQPAKTAAKRSHTTSPRGCASEIRSSIGHLTASTDLPKHCIQLPKVASNHGANAINYQIFNHGTRYGFNFCG
jgi:hypothetical protein